MLICLTPEQETWIKARVAAGDFPSVEEAARQLIDERIAEHADDAEESMMMWRGRSLNSTKHARTSRAAT